MNITKIREKVNYYDKLVRQYCELETAIKALKESSQVEIGFIRDEAWSMDSRCMPKPHFTFPSSKYRFRLSDDLDMTSTEENINEILRIDLDHRKKEIEAILSKFKEEN